MSRYVFSVKPGFDRVQAGADPRIEITPAKPFTTADPILVAELRANTFLNAKTATVKPKTPKAKPRKTADAATPPPASAPTTAPSSDGGVS